MTAILRTAFALFVLLLSPMAGSADSPTHTEEFLLGDWEGTNSVGTKITAKFEKDGAATFRFFFEGKVTPWKMKYSIDTAGSKIAYAGKKPNGNTWEGELSASGEDQLTGDYTYFNSSSNRTFPSSLTLKRAGK